MAENRIEVYKVSPPAGSPTEICLPLTFFDLIWLRFPPIERLFFYEAPHSEQLISCSIIPKLKHSLSLTLQHFLPLAGNITWPSSSLKPVIHYKEGDGVLFTVAVSDDDFHHVTGKSIRRSKIFDHLVAHIAGSNWQVPAFAVKVSIFPDKGFCIGITSHHGFFDGKSVSMFMKSWASISKFGENEKGLDPELTPLFDRKAVREQYAEIENLYLEMLQLNGVAQNSLAIRELETQPDRIRGTFELSGMNVRKLKENISNRVLHISTFTVVYAFVILCIVRAKGITKGNRVLVGFPADIRGRLEPKLPANYFGNCVAFCDGVSDRDELLGSNGMAVIASLISESIKGIENGVIEKMKQNLSKTLYNRKPDEAEATELYVTGSSRFGFQTIDFGWGRPKKVDMSQVDKLPGASFTDLEDGGLEIELSLNEHEMERFSYEFAQGLDKMAAHN